MRIPAIAIAACLFAHFMPAHGALAATVQRVTLGDDDGMAIDQGQGAFELIDESVSGGKSLGPDAANTCVFDTGSEGILVSGEAVNELTAAGMKTQGQYYEEGVAGSSVMDVSLPYTFAAAGASGVPVSIPNTRVEASADLDLDDFYAVVGMPLLGGRMLKMDLSTLGNQDIGQMTTDFVTAVPAAAHQYHLPLSYVFFPQTGQAQPADPLPTGSANPFIGVRIEFNGKAAQGNFLFDSGAQVSMVSTAIAKQLGLDTAHPIDTIDLGGIGGTVTVPIVDAGTWVVTSSEGVELAWTKAQVGVVDIDPAIPGVFGMDFPDSGWLNVAMNGTGVGFLQQLFLDFTGMAAGKGALVVNVTPALDRPVPVDEGSAVAVTAPAPHAPLKLNAWRWRRHAPLAAP